MGLEEVTIAPVLLEHPAQKGSKGKVLWSLCGQDGELRRHGVPHSEQEARAGVVVHACSPSYSGTGDRRIMSSRPALQS
jgi:hypothetical protein